MEVASLQSRCQEYLSSRVSDYEFRCIRFRAVYDEMVKMGLADGDTVYDLGAGRCDFDKFLREQGWAGQYVPVDGSIDGTDLQTWMPPGYADFFVAIEVIEHLHRPWPLLRWMQVMSRKGAVVTTPNPLTTDVLGMDYTHVTPVYAASLEYFGWKTRGVNLFLQDPEDSIIATFGLESE